MKRDIITPLCAAMVILASCILPVKAANTLHAISFCATEAENIAEGVKLDYENFLMETAILADQLGYDRKMYAFPHEVCTKDNLYNVLNQLQCSPDDIVIFYYSGHGGRNPNDKSQFPQMCLKYNGYQQANFVPVHEVQTRLANKNARLTLILSDCCNVADNGISSKLIEAPSRGATTNESDIAERMRKLFHQAKGMLTFTGSQVGKPSYGPDNIGGLFSVCFWMTLHNVGKGDVAPEWATVVDTTKKLTAYVSKNNQHPLAQNNIVAASASTNVQPTTTTVAVTPNPNPVNATNTPLSNDIQRMLSISPSHNSDSRLAIARDIVSSRCTPTAMVQVVGRDRTTVVETRRADSYFNALAISPHVKSIAVLEERPDNSGRVSYLKVHEIRNK